MGAFNMLAQYILGGASEAVSVGSEVNEAGFKVAQAKTNQQIAQQAGADAIARGGIEAGKVRERGTQVAGEQRVAFAASGVDATQGTAARVQAATAGISELDAQTAENNAAREAWGYKQQAAQFGSQAEMERQKGISQVRGTILGALGGSFSSLGAGGGK